MKTDNEISLVLEEIEVQGYEKVVYITEKNSQLKSIICIHNTTLGPALGGLRIYPYSNFDEALADVLRLSEGMTYKSALAETGLGGGKSVIILDPRYKTNQILKAFGKAINHLSGSYICAEDVNCSVEDIDLIGQHTSHVVGLSHNKSSGNPALFTAWGTFRGIQAVLQSLDNSNSVEGKTIAIQGLGSVGSILADFLFWHGAHLIVTDLDPVRAERIGRKYGAKIVDPKDIISQKCDVFSPCAMGGVINQNSLSSLNCRAIAGCANNQLASPQDAMQLKKNQILYAPDFVISAGGIINVSIELNKEGYNPIRAHEKTHRIYDILLQLFQIAEKNQISTHDAAIALANYRLQYKIGKRKDPISYFETFQPC